MKVCINAGHGGGDPGAIGKSWNTKEKDVTLKLSLKLGEILKKRGVEVKQTRIDDSIDMDLETICDISNNFQSDFFVSIHCNAASSQAAYGYETYYYSEEGKKYAEKIQDSIINRVKGFYVKEKQNNIDRGVKNSGFYVIRYTDCPAVLIECGFVSNKYEEALMVKEEWIDRVANAIADSIKTGNNTGNNIEEKPLLSKIINTGVLVEKMELLPNKNQIKIYYK